MSTKVDPIEKAIPQNSIRLKLCITPQTAASLQNLVNKRTLEVPPVLNRLTG